MTAADVPAGMPRLTPWGVLTRWECITPWLYRVRARQGSGLRVVGQARWCLLPETRDSCRGWYVDVLDWALVVLICEHAIRRDVVPEFLPRLDRLIADARRLLHLGPIFTRYLPHEVLARQEVQ